MKSIFDENYRNRCRMVYTKQYSIIQIVFFDYRLGLSKKVNRYRLGLSKKVNRYY